MFLLQVAKQTNGNWGTVRNGRVTTNEEATHNQLRELQIGGRENSETRRLLLALSAEIRPFEGLKITNQLGYNYYDYRGFRFQNTKPAIPNFLEPKTGVLPGTASDVNQMNQDWRYSQKLVYDGWLNYDKTFNEKHALSVVAGVHADTYMYKKLALGRKSFASNEMNDLSGGSEDPVNQIPTKSAYEEETMNSYFGRIGYTYDNRYLFEANFRADASSRFAKEGRWGYFPSFSAGWRIDQEAFMESLDWLSSLKLRASWGKNGNINNIGLYDTYSTFNSGGTVVLGGENVPILTEGRIANPDLTWEKTTTSNIGLDLSVLNGLFSMNLDLYNRLTDGILVNATDIASETGLSDKQMPKRNVGQVRNRGLELALTHNNMIGDFSYQLGFNLTCNDNEILDLGEGVDELPPSGQWIMRKGGSIGDFYMLEANGLYSTQDVKDGKVIPYGKQVPEAGMIRFVDQLTEDTDGDGIPDKADGVINDKDRTIVGNDVPSLTYGMNIDMNYKGFGLSITGQGVTGVKVYMTCEAAQAFFDNSVPRHWQLDNWTEQNQGAVYPKLFVPADQRFKYNSKNSSFWLFDASYFRLKNITFSYTLPKNFIAQIGLTNARVYVSGENMFTIRGDKRMKDFDPESVTGRGYAIGHKTLTAGVNISF